MRQSFIKGFGKGTLGGASIYAGKSIAHMIYKKENLWYAWPSRILTSFGSSVVSNGMHGRGTFEEFRFHLGPVRLEYSTKAKDFKARINTSALYSTIHVGSQGNLNFAKSLETGLLIFENDSDFSFGGLNASAISALTTIGIRRDPSYYLLAHELIHTLQYEGMPWLNPLFNKVDKSLKSKSKIYNQLSKYFYLDLDAPMFYLIYDYNIPWSCRYFEREADHFAARINHQKCK